METYEQKKRRLLGKRLIPIYLEEVNRLLNIIITEKDLFSIVETDDFFKNHRIENRPFFKATIPFERKDVLRRLLDELSEKNFLIWNKSYRFYSRYTISCGTFKVPSLHCLNLDFNFYDEHSGFFTFTSEDGEDKICFSCDEEFNEYFLEIELYKKVGMTKENTKGY